MIYSCSLIPFIHHDYPPHPLHPRAEKVPNPKPNPKVRIGSLTPRTAQFRHPQRGRRQSRSGHRRNRLRLSCLLPTLP